MFHNLLNNVELCCSGHILRTIDNHLFLSQTSQVIVSNDQWYRNEWDTLSKKWDAPIIPPSSNPRPDTFERWILDQPEKIKKPPKKTQKNT